MKERPLLLLSNDDGVQAKGIQELIKALRPIADLLVIAPDGPRSGASGSITSENPLRCTLIKQEPGLTLYKCTGTPVDCVKLALHALTPRTPDLVIGGINHGDNFRSNVHLLRNYGSCHRRLPEGNLFHRLFIMQLCSRSTLLPACPTFAASPKRFYPTNFPKESA